MISKSRVDFGRPMVVGRGFGGGWSVRVDLRMVSVCALVAAAAIIVGVVTLCVGDLPIAPDRVLAAIMGDGSRMETTVVVKWRMPRVVLALVLGALLGASGAIFQSVTRNPLGSPDVIGLSAGAGAGAAVVALYLPGALPVPVGALAGAATAMALVYLSTGTGFRDPGRLIVAGIGVFSIATAFSQYVVYAVERDKAAVLTAYINGSLAARSWSHAGTIWAVFLAVVPLVMLIARRLVIGEMGDELAGALGAGPRSTRAWAVTLSIVLSAGAVSVAGPVAFLSLTAPQIARRLTGRPGPHLTPAALVGALLLVLADLAAQQAPVPVSLPVGIYTLAIGGVYLGYLLTREWRKGRL